ncbi:type I restriction endonuclease subunit R [Luteipulveratus flavus]|uniref:Type I restriction enzyme endonuclease subunit n=1 Tax=Luteipulveratus flavus TaxID=3031728 RepID=A0ABT6C6N3_9MICO|nr:type I restriction endonuclease subunit R [Luteipulveratus sp. YIM 133296]MDF8263739.1 type I restriction endonuclease subunit R [Luteipulveratus sp. YIM 133296]
MALTATGFSEADWEELALDTLGELGWQPKEGAALAPGSGERESWDDLVLRGRLLQAMRDLNPGVPEQYLQQTMADILAPKSQDAITENHRVHDLLVGGYRGTTYVDHDGVEQHPTIHLMSTDPDRNDWVAAHQVTIRDRDRERRFDVVLYCNGLPVSIIELKKAGSKTATVAAAHAQLQTYVEEFPMAFRFAVCTVASDGVQARYGTPFTPLNHFAVWNVDDSGHPMAIGEADEDGRPVTELELTLQGLFNLERFVQLQHSFTAFDEDERGLAKRIAKPHQYFAVTKAVASTIEAVGSDGRAGVVWHTQGSGKSMEMELYANLVSRHPRLLNPTIVVITDRNELDGQLYGAFDKSLLLSESPKQITRRAQLREELTDRVTGGIYFTTLQKFGKTKAEKESGADHPVLCDRRNVIVIVDEAHRSHYDDLDGYARHLKDALPHATLIAFTGTPVAQGDRDTRKVFGDDIDVYDLNRAVEDGATVPVLFEPRLIKVERKGDLDDESLDAAADEATAGLDDAERTKVEQSVAVLNAVYGTPARLATLADDFVAHWEARRERMRPFIGADGKAMIVCATRQICADLYDAITALRKDWHSDDISKGVIKVVYSGDPSDTGAVKKHVRRPSENATIKQRLKDVDDELEIVIVKDMMLTGYDSPPLHTLYLDRPIKGALLMQTLARVNRTFRGKEEGLLVAYAPVADNLTKALAEYTVAGGRDQRDAVGRGVEEAVELALDLVVKLRALVAPVDWKGIWSADPKRGFAHAVQATTNFLRTATPGQGDDDSETPAAAYRRLSTQLARAWALAPRSEELENLLPELRFYEEVRVWMAKFDVADRQARGEPVPEDAARLLGELIVTSTEAGGIVDIYEAAGLPKPSLSDLSTDFVEKAQQSSAPQLAIEALRASILAESARVTRGNVVRQRAFSQRLAELMAKYTNQQLTSAEIIAELVELAKEVAADADRGSRFDPPMNGDELAYYDVVSANESAVDVMGDDVLAQIARELVQVMRRDVRTDWTVRDDVRAKLRSSIKRLLVKHGWPPDQQPGAIKDVMEQMEAMAPRYAEERRRR